MSNIEEVTVIKNKCSVLKERKTYWYTVSEIRAEGACPSCGRSIVKFKNITAHVKRCFSIRKIGPIYRLHGYVECKCGLLIADNSKAQKLHVCMGEVPAFEPDLSFLRKTAPTDQQGENQGRPVSSHLERELLQPKPWIRNFVSPFKLVRENIHESPKPEHRVRNFDMPTCSQEPQNVSVYNISSNNGTISVTGESPKLLKQSVIMIRKRALRLPRLQNDKYS